MQQQLISSAASVVVLVRVRVAAGPLAALGAHAGREGLARGELGQHLLLLFDLASSLKTKCSKRL